MYFATKLILMFTISVVRTNGSYIEWSPESIERSDLRCPSRCKEENLHELERPGGKGQLVKRCCVCESKPEWRLPANYTVLKTEYVSRFGATIILGNQLSPKVSILKHSNGFMSRLPKNLCDFKRIVEIKVSKNQIRAVGNISCLIRLDTVDLSFNKLRYISNDTFTSLRYLRILKLSHNGITNLEPFAVAGPSLSIAHLDFSFNNLTEIEVSNIIPENNFCSYYFENNQIEEIVNNGGFKLDLNKIYEGGFVSLTGNIFTNFIDFDKLGITDITQLGKVMNFGFSLEDADFTCDCHMAPYLKLAKPIMEKIWRNYFNMTCGNPPELQDQSVPALALENKLDLLICNVTEKCPKYCRCIENTVNHTMIVDCERRNFTKIPRELPEAQNLILKFKKNNIKSFDAREYFQNATYMDFSDNGIDEVIEESIILIDKSIDLVLKGHNMKTLPRHFKLMNPCKAKLGETHLKCGCNEIWIGDWLRNKKADQCPNETLVLCHTTKGIIPALSLMENDVCDKSNFLFLALSIIFSLLSSIIIGLSGIFYLYRYEIYILTRNVLFKHSNKITEVPKFEVYLSFDENHTEIRKWVLRTLEPNLRQAGYNVFIPCRDFLPGQIMETEIIENVNSSKNFIIILSEMYVEDDNIWKVLEWKYIWHCYKRNKERKIVIINYDLLDSPLEPKLRAFIRLGFDIDFANRKKFLTKEVKIKLGPPRCSQHREGNAKTRFNLSKMVKNEQKYTVKSRQPSLASMTDLKPINVLPRASQQSLSSMTDVKAENMLTKGSQSSLPSITDVEAVNILPRERKNSFASITENGTVNIIPDGMPPSLPFITNIEAVHTLAENRLASAACIGDPC